MTIQALRAKTDVQFLSALAILVVVGMLSAWSHVQLLRSNRQVIHSQQVLEDLALVLSTLQDAETGQRGYLLTGNPNFLEPYERARRTLPEVLVQLRRQTRAVPGYAPRLERIERAAARKMDLSMRTVRLWERGDSLLARQIVQSGQGKRAMDEARAQIAAARRDELAVLARRTEESARNSRLNQLFVLVGSALALLLVWHARGITRAELMERRRAERESRQLNRQKELILASAADGIFGLDREGTVVFANRSAAAMLGLAPAAMTGRHVQNIFHHTRPDGTRYGLGEGPIFEALQRGTAQTAAAEWFWSADGARFPVEYAANPIREEDEITGAVVTFRDISARRELERTKDEFLAVVSHELRTPLTSIRASLGLLASGKLGRLEPKGQRMLEIASQNADRLVRLINDMLDLERLEAGEVGLELQRTDLARLMFAAAETVRPAAAQAGIPVEVAAVPTTALVDADRITQVLLNLLSNAAKFAEPPFPIRMALVPVADGVEISVANRGRGIPADKLESVFERFQQVDSSDARQKGGTGLGLAICRTIVEQHGGRIRAQSEPGGDTVFTFSLPSSTLLAETTAPSPRPPAPAAALSASSAAGPDVLIVEDDDDLAGVLAETLRHAGYTAQAVPSAEDAVEQLRHAVPQLLILDLSLPGADGFAFIDWLRGEPRLASVRVVVYTARDLNGADRVRLGTAAGDVLTKSRTDPRDFERRIVRLLQEITAARAAG